MYKKLDASITVLNTTTPAALDREYSTHTIRQSVADTNAQVAKWSLNVELNSSDNLNKMEATVGFEWNLKSSVQQMISYEVVNP